MEKYTVIIPTRDRAETLGATLRTCLRQTYKNFEIIVSDNCSTDNTKEVVDCCGDARIRYINPGKRLSMSGNFEFALGHVTDGFVMFIGSDDGIMPNAIEYVDSIVKRYKVDAVSCNQATYVWPNFPDKHIAGKLTFGGLRNNIEIRKSNEWLRKTLDFQVPYCFDLPNLYCGFVHKNIIDKAYKDDKYFRSITPDAYSALATAICVDRYAFSYKPFSIAGASIKSNGASSMYPTANKEESAKFLQENDIEIFEGFVNCPSFEVVLAEAFAQLDKAFPTLCKSYNINYEAMLQSAIKNSNERTRESINAAVAEMEINFGVKIDENISNKKMSYADIPGMLSRVFLNLISPRIIAVKNSIELGINNIDDAAMLASALLGTKSTTKFTTTRDLIKERIKQVMNV